MADTQEVHVDQGDTTRLLMVSMELKGESPSKAEQDVYKYEERRGGAPLKYLPLCRHEVLHYQLRL